jgi:pyruvate formate lyase activating enzyme
LSDAELRDTGKITGCVFNIERFATRDGPGIRTTVFLKGCPLRCLWCSNPESMKPFPQMMYFERLCQRCYRCVDVCAYGATKANAEGAIEIDRSLCTDCGKCVEACPAKAREISGKLMTVDEVLEEVKQDSLFYQNSGGGVTASGGEPTQQPEFARELFRRCQDAAIHTCLDTCGFARAEILQSVLEFTSLVLFDVKHMDSAKHKKLTGVDNSLILDNLRMVAGQAKPVIVRVPLIPGYNDSEVNLRALAKLMNELGLKRVDILPYHNYGLSKYERLGMVCELENLEPHTEAQIEGVKSFLESFGLEAGVG